MSIRSIAEGAARKAEAAIAAPLSEQEREAVTRAIEGAVIDAIKNTMQECRDAALGCTREQKTKAKIVIELNKTATAKFLDMGAMR